jgi:hypothetical protein
MFGGDKIMNIKKAAEETLEHLNPTAWEKDARLSTNASGYDHIEWMLKGIAEGYIQYEKAHRWLGWAQACIFIQQHVPLETFKKINKAV